MQKINYMLILSFFCTLFFFLVFFTFSQALLITLVMSSIYYFAKELGRESYSILQTITFFYSFAITVTSIVTIWAIMNGSINDKGKIEPWISDLLVFVFAIEHDAVIFFALWGIFFLPQLGSFILSGIVGYAPKIKYFDLS